MKRDDSFKRGKNNIEMILLNILCDDDYYGYQLSQLVSEYSKNMISIPEGSLYPALYRLQENGFISAEKKLVGKRLERIYYHIEPAGKEYLETLITDYNHLNQAIHNILSHKPIQQEE
ncbi:MAG: PadR family transcriptional regulator [Lachnospiraceae bacterium]|nr:PadR family transcriptional regulator [Lachnospiraceae bacterium]